MLDKDSVTDFLPEGFTPLGFVVAVKCLDNNGNVSLATYRSDDISAWEAWGMLSAQIEDVRRDMLEAEVTDD